MTESLVLSSRSGIGESFTMQILPRTVGNANSWLLPATSRCEVPSKIPRGLRRSPTSLVGGRRPFALDVLTRVPRFVWGGCPYRDPTVFVGGALCGRRSHVLCGGRRPFALSKIPRTVRGRRSHVLCGRYTYQGPAQAGRATEIKMHLARIDIGDAEPICTLMRAIVIGGEQMLANDSGLAHTTPWLHRCQGA